MRYNGTNYNKIISFDNNPILKFLNKFRFYEIKPKDQLEEFTLNELYDKLKGHVYLALLEYISNAYEKGCDASEEDWIYAKTTYIRNDGFLYAPEDIDFAISINAKHQSCVSDGARKNGNLSRFQREIYDKALSL